jgi:tetratricopeptide (TPR) repeat protein
MISLMLKLGLLFVLSPQTASQQKYSIHGSIVFEGSFGNRPVVVYLEPLSSRPVEEVRTDESGNFAFRNLPEGSYYIRVNVEGFAETAQRIEIPAFEGSVVFVLQRKTDTPPSEVEIGSGGEFEAGINELSIPANAAGEYQKALDDNKEGKISRAIGRLQRVLSIAPRFIQASFHLGWAFYKAGHFEDAEKVLMRALKTAPKEPHLRLMLANVFLKQHKYDQALSQIEAYLKENPDGPERTSAKTTRAQLIEAIQK